MSAPDILFPLISSDLGNIIQNQNHPACIISTEDKQNEANSNLEIESRRADLYKNYHEICGRMIDELMDGDSDSLWLTHPANRLLRTGGLRWAVAPMTVHGRFHGMDSGHQEEISLEGMGRLEPFSFVLFTHNHVDHLDISLARALRDFPIKWVMAADMWKKLAPGVKIFVSGIGEEVKLP